MKLEGSCHCGAVKFTVESHTPYPFNYCYCSICRKVNGGGGFNINIMADANTLEVTGMDNVSIYRSRENQRGAYEADGLGFSRRHFCKTCATMLWSFNPNYPDWIYPYASAIDTQLPAAPQRKHFMLSFKPDWVPVELHEGDTQFEHYPDGSIEEWHKSRNLWQD